MAGREEEGYYCSICGGIPPERVRTRKITVDGKETGIENLDIVFERVMELHTDDEERLRNEILKRVREFNYIPSKKERAYGEALLNEFRRWKGETGGEKN